MSAAEFRFWLGVAAAFLLAVGYAVAAIRVGRQNRAAGGCLGLIGVAAFCVALLCVVQTY